MTLNDCVAQARACTGEVESLDEMLYTIHKGVKLLERFKDDAEARAHQFADLVFLLFEFAAAQGIDLDAEWENILAKKRMDYLRMDDASEEPT